MNTPARSEVEPTLNPTSSIAQDVIQRKGAYGRFAERWFSKNGWIPSGTKVQSAASNALQAVIPVKAASGPEEPGASKNERDAVSSQDVPAVAITLLPKILKTLNLMFNSKCFYFSHDLDITRRLGTQQSRSAGVPLSKLADPLVSSYCSLNLRSS